MPKKKPQPDKVAELTADLQRIQADFMNFKRRSAQSHQDLMDMAKQAVVLQILPLVDNIARAQSHVPAELEPNTWVQGMLQIASQAQQVLAQLGVEHIETRGAIFDPHLHEAVGFEEGEGDQEIIAEELQAGYRLGSKVIRPAMVKVKRVNKQSLKEEK
mgnify:CR=1 FL=1